MSKTIEPGAFVTLHYRLHSMSRDIVNTFGSQPATITLGNGAMATALEDCLLGLAEGTKHHFSLPAGTVFGAHDAQKVQWVARSLLSSLQTKEQVYAVGDVVQFPLPNGSSIYQGQYHPWEGAALAGAVRQVETERVLFDFNHPLAGQAVEFEVQIIGIL